MVLNARTNWLWAISPTTVAVLSDPKRFERLKPLQAKPQMSQRKPAQAVGVSLGKADETTVHRDWVARIA